MEASELRIGNLLRTTVTNTWIEVTIYELLEIINNPKDHQLEPIPITENILLKFGFIDCFSEFIGVVPLSFSMRAVKSGVRSAFYLDGEIPEPYKIRVDSVHQLQNIVFSLTGEELEIPQNPQE